MTEVVQDPVYEQLALRNDELLEITRFLTRQLEQYENQPEVLMERMHISVPLPARLTPGSAGWDLTAMAGFDMGPGERHAFPLGIKLAIPEGYVGFLWPRSGLAYHHGIDRLAGVIDSDYRGECKAILINHGDDPLVIKAGERICQLVVVPILTRMVEVESLSMTERDSAGFGSTGL